jgi:hypothetical protein
MNIYCTYTSDVDVEMTDLSNRKQYLQTVGISYESLHLAHNHLESGRVSLSRGMCVPSVIAISEERCRCTIEPWT